MLSCVSIMSHFVWSQKRWKGKSHMLESISGSFLKTLHLKNGPDWFLETHAEDELDLVSSPERAKYNRIIYCPERVAGRMGPCWPEVQAVRWEQAAGELLCSTEMGHGTTINARKMKVLLLIRWFPLLSRANGGFSSEYHCHPAN